MTIGRPVVKTAKEAAKAAAPVAGTRTRTTGVPIIGRPVVTAATPTKTAKVPGVGDSPQTSAQLQQQQPIPGQPPQAMAAGARIGTAGPQTPGSTIQVRVAFSGKEGLCGVASYAERETGVTLPYRVSTDRLDLS